MYHTQITLNMSFLHMFASVQTAVLSDFRPHKVQLPVNRMARRFVSSIIRYSRSFSGNGWLRRNTSNYTTTTIAGDKFAHSNFSYGSGLWYNDSILHSYRCDVSLPAITVVKLIYDCFEQVDILEYDSRSILMKIKIRLRFYLVNLITARRCDYLASFAEFNKFIVIRSTETSIQRQFTARIFLVRTIY